MKIKILKEYKLEGKRNNRPRKPIIFGDKIYLIFVYDKEGFIESRIQCLNIANLDLIWEFLHPHVINNIFISSNQTLIASCMNGMLISFDIANGNKLWTFETGGTNIGPCSTETDGKIIVSNVQTKEGVTWCINVFDGNLVWRTPNTGHSYTPIIHNGLVYNCIGNNIFCLNLIDGSTLWSQREERTYLLATKIFKDIVIASGHGVLNFYQQTSGVLLQSIETGEKGAINKLINDEENIYFGDETGFFYAYQIDDVNIQLKWKVNTGGTIASFPELKNNDVFVLNDAKKLIALAKVNGNLVFEKKIKGEGFISGVTVSNDKLYFSCKGGFLYECETID